MFNSGIRPAISTGLSVSRVGGAAQTKIVKKLAGGLRIAAAQYRELEAFSQFASDLDEATRKQLERGQRIYEMLKQAQYQPLDVAQTAFSWFVVEKGYLDDVELDKVTSFEAALHAYLADTQSALMESINAKPVLDAEMLEQMNQLLEQFKSTQTW